MERIQGIQSLAGEVLAAYLRYPYNRFHQYLFLRRAQKTLVPLDDRRGAIDIVLAPRGGAKSTLMSLVFPLDALVRKTDRYILIISATQRQARVRLGTLRSVLRTSEELGNYCPALTERWDRDTCDIIEVDGVRIEACSAGSELRGLSYGPWRPTWIVLDDVEDSRRISNRHYRDNLERWIYEVIEYLGDSFTNIDWVGTLLHRDALPVRVSKRPDIRYRLYRSILRESDRSDLWEQWKRILQKADEPDRLASARRFFEAHREDMLSGAVVLWPAKEDYYDLQLMRMSQGVIAFNKEKQNEPPPEVGGFFDLDSLRMFHLMDNGAIWIEDENERLAAPGPELEELTTYGFLDPVREGARAGEETRDFAAIATVGRDRYGRIFVLDVWLERAPVSRQIMKAFDLHEQWTYTRFGVETNAFQRMLIEAMERERNERRLRGDISDLPIQPVEQHENKTARIMRLEARVSSGFILFSRDLSQMFMDQLESFPSKGHDDGPDALEGAIGLVLRDQRRITGSLEVRRAPRRGARQF